MSGEGVTTPTAPTLVISPHLDDAVLSVGQTMAKMRNVTVLTCLAGSPPEGTLTDYDRDSGFGSSVEAMNTRRAENHAACEVIGADHVELPYLDRQYMETDHSGVEYPDLTAGPIAAKIEEARAWRILCPLGIGHPDHRLVGAYARSVVRPGVDAVYFYEELPYRVWWPEQVHETMAVLHYAGWEFADCPHPFPTANMSVKREALSCYASQLGADPTEHDPCFYVPERVWQVVR